jgi:hypothetical protein
MYSCCLTMRIVDCEFCASYWSASEREQLHCRFCACQTSQSDEMSDSLRTCQNDINRILTQNALLLHTSYFSTHHENSFWHAKFLDSPSMLAEMLKSAPCLKGSMHITFFHEVASTRFRRVLPFCFQNASLVTSDWCSVVSGYNSHSYMARDTL